MNLHGTMRVVRLVLRRDRLRLPLWVGGLAAIMVLSSFSLVAAYPDQASIDAYAALVGSNPAVVAFVGPGYGMDDPTIGGVLVNELQLWGMIGVALMSIFLVNRHTRAEEDVERAELLRSSVLGRHALAGGAVVVVALANVAIVVLSVVGFVLAGYDAVGSIALGLSLLAVGWVFVGVTLVAAQVMSSGRATLGAATAVLGIMFVLRAIGDIGENWVRWLSPIGWAQSVRAFAGEQWWTIALSALLAVGLVGAGFWLATRRDLGSGLVAPRLGPATASRATTRPIGLTWRQNRGMAIGWFVGLALTGIIYGSMGEEIGSLIEENDFFREVMAQLSEVDVVDSYFGTAMVMLALIAAGYTIATVLRMRMEESAGRVEPLLATPLSRLRWSLGYLVVALVGTTVLMVGAGAGTGLAYAAVAEEGAQVGRLVAAGLVTVPPVLVFGGLSVALFGWWPRAVAIAWAALAVVTVIELLGEVLRLPEWSRRLSPFQHVPRLPAESWSWPPVLVMLLVALGLGALGVWGFRRRDLQLH